MATLLPSRAKLRRLREEPRWRQSNTLTAFPIRATLRSARPLLVFENNHLSNDTRYGTAALLEAHGYVKTDEVEHNEVWAPALVQSGRRLRRPHRSRPVLL